MAKGGFQTNKVTELYCKCGKCTSKILDFMDKEISIHFTRKSTYWHIYNKETKVVKRTFKKPEQWN
jgi:hypothetical protein